MHLQRKTPSEAKATLDNLAHLTQAYEKHMCFVKMYEFQSLRDVNTIMNELADGNIMILNAEPLLAHETNSMLEVKRAIDQLRGYCREVGGDIKRLGDYMLVVTPNHQYKIT